jgi:hypothetical protein
MMTDIFKCQISLSWHSWYTKFLLGCWRFQWVVLWSVVIWILYGPKLHAATESSSTELNDNWLSRSQLIKQVNSVHNLETLDKKEYIRQRLKVRTTADSLHSDFSHSKQIYLVPLPYHLESIPFLIAAPENFNPGLRLPPPELPSQKNSSSLPSTKPVKPIFLLESIYTDFHNDTDNFGLENLFIEPKAQFRLRNGNKIFFQTGFNYFKQPGVESITNIPFQVGWEGKVDHLTLQTTVGINLFDRLPTAINFNGKVEAPILPLKVSSSGKLLSGALLSANLEQGPYKFNALTLEHQVTAWRFGPNLYWQIDRDTSFFSLLRLGNYNDRNSEVQSFSRLEHKLGQFTVAANLFTWSYQRDLEHKNGYFSPPDFLVYNAELGWEGDIFRFLRCRLSANIGQQRLKGKFDNANSYQSHCTVKLSPNLEVDLGYTFTNVRSHETDKSGYGGNSLFGQLRVKF